jgi:hypothetical protein
MNFQFGIEHEVAFFNGKGQFADFTNTKFDAFDRIIQSLPLHPEDKNCLRLGDSGIRKKRWYIEGFERFSSEGTLLDCLPKGIEIRTSTHSTIDGVIHELVQSYQQLIDEAFKFGFEPIALSFNPTQIRFIPDPPLNSYEQSEGFGELFEQLPMLTYGPDLNLSFSGWTPLQLIDLGRKLNYYSPYLLPFSYSPCYYAGKPWSGQSIRTYKRSPIRPAVLVYLQNADSFDRQIYPWLRQAKLPAEAGRIEFKAFDTCGDFRLYRALLLLLKGLILDRQLPGRITMPDVEMHRRSALRGFKSPSIQTIAQQVLTQVATELNSQEIEHLAPLRQMLTATPNLGSGVGRTHRFLTTLNLC